MDERMLRRYRLFSERHAVAIEKGCIEVDLTKSNRDALWSVMCDFNSQTLKKPFRYDSWEVTSTELEELAEDLNRRTGDLRLTPESCETKDNADLLRLYFYDVSGDKAFDVLELFWAMKLDQSDLEIELNEALRKTECPWVMIGGHFFRLDDDWITENVLNPAHEELAADFAGANHEFQIARACLLNGEFKQSVLESAKSMESVLKAILDRPHGTAKVLIDELKTNGFYTGLPDDLAKSFGDSVLLALPYIRNKVAGHGQGSDIVEVPKSLAELALHLAAAFNRFLLCRMSEINRNKESHDSDDVDDIPF